MNVFLPSRLALWASATAISLPYACKAQNTTNSTDIDRCHSLGEFSSSAIVNSTGSQSFRWSSQEKDWYFTTTFNDTRDPLLVGGLQDLEGYISAPADTEAEVCVYMMRGVNTTGGGGDGCEGVLSQSCVDWLTKTVTYAPWNDGRRERCANTPQREEVETTCGGDVGFYASTVTPELIQPHMYHLVSTREFYANGLPDSQVYWYRHVTDELRSIG
ncbi:hypothetical protein BDU57DRAFT_331056 [Ampelomyces quisqualis]|uniref:Uncharacterized protein n=1 Tax=Ampelomyces quisqualis TaxID=50730 RepID=A0A6A5QFA8_AMPQU|nr:hypothetical protein BDU57DRAFT_331056 [Ampelomyces quisqualis]